MSEAQRVLVLDDDPIVGKVLVAHVRSLGYDVQFTTDPLEFLDLQRTWEPSRVVLDLVMSAMDGLEVLSRLADMTCEATIIISSGMGSRVMDAAKRVADAAGLRIAGLLPKPYTRSQLAELLAVTEYVDDAPFQATTSTRPWWSARDFPEVFQHAIDAGHISVAFQPKVDCQTSRVEGYEALARWCDPERGDIGPADFVPIAERTGVVSLLTDAVADAALGWLSSQPFVGERHVSINVSAAELSDASVDRRLLRACERYGVQPDAVVIELTETSAMDDPVVSLELLTRLRIEGFRVSLDDFGTGYSSMLQLARMPFSEVKVDRSFVMNAASNDESVIVVRSIVDLAHALGMQCTAEGVQDAATLDLLRALGCDHAQGYHIAQPMLAHEIADWHATVG